MRLTLAERGKVFLDYRLPHFLQLIEGPAHCRLKVIQKPVCGSLGSVERHEPVEEVVGFPSFLPLRYCSLPFLNISVMILSYFS
jgi:hypothetical protein